MVETHCLNAGYGPRKLQLTLSQGIVQSPIEPKLLQIRQRRDNHLCSHGECLGIWLHDPDTFAA
jgi:hypothetical protein